MSQAVLDDLKNDIKAQIVLQLREKKAYDRNDSKLLELIEKQASERAAHLYRSFVLNTGGQTCENAVCCKFVRTYENAVCCSFVLACENAVCCIDVLND